MDGKKTRRLTLYVLPPSAPGKKTTFQNIYNLDSLNQVLTSSGCSLIRYMVCCFLLFPVRSLTAGCRRNGPRWVETSSQRQAGIEEKQYCCSLHPLIRLISPKCQTLKGNNWSLHLELKNLKPLVTLSSFILKSLNVNISTTLENGHTNESVLLKYTIKSL